MKRTFMAVCLSCVSLLAFAQHNEEQEAFHPHHTLGIDISHTQITEGIGADGHKKWLSLPSWGLNYNYKFHPKWAIGLHNDIVAENFEVSEHLNTESEKALERSFPFASAAMVSFKPGHHFNYMLGPGGEFAKEGNLFLIRIGVEYECHISKGWELNAVITNDYKVNAYNSWSIGLGITKIL
ncbi:MAG TPA: hypothetical protein PLA68_01065 [Panacibacter sp.]|nr:hypothetical protein [Panacibacter sp.]